MIGWLIVIAYLAVGYFCALSIGPYVRERQLAQIREDHRKYPTLYDTDTTTKRLAGDLDLFPVVMAVLGGLFCWPVAWPVMHIVRLIVNNKGEQQ